MGRFGCCGTLRCSQLTTALARFYSTNLSQLFKGFTAYMKLDAGLGNEMPLDCHIIVICLSKFRKCRRLAMS